MDAVIDIGSNSVRLMIDRGERVNKKILDSTTLADGLALTGVLRDDAMQRTQDAVVRFVKMAKQQGADNVYVFATEAMRSAKNGAQFAQKLSHACGVTVDVVSGKDEGLLGLYGALDDDHDEITVIDIGGASVEIVRGNKKVTTYARSLPLGMVRLIDTVGSNENEIDAYVTSHITQFGIVSGHETVAIGGTATALASMALGQKIYDAQQIHGYELDFDTLAYLRKQIFSSKNVQADFPTLSKNRARIIGHGSIMLQRLIEFLGTDSVRVSEHDNLEGYLLLKRLGR